MVAEGWQLPPHGTVCLKELVADFYHEQGRWRTLPPSQVSRVARTKTNEWIFSELYLAYTCTQDLHARQDGPAIQTPANTINPCVPVSDYSVSARFLLRNINI